jgi:hypothetical protein
MILTVKTKDTVLTSKGTTSIPAAIRQDFLMTLKDRILFDKLSRRGWTADMEWHPRASRRALKRRIRGSRILGAGVACYKPLLRASSELGARRSAIRRNCFQ